MTLLQLCGGGCLLWLALGLASWLAVWLFEDRIVADEPVEVEDWLTENLPKTNGSKTNEYGGEAFGLAPGIDY